LTIVAAAIRLPAAMNASNPHRVPHLFMYMPPPARHHNILHSLVGQIADEYIERTNESYVQQVEGFLTDKGEFLDRRQAFLHARKCGQRITRPADGYQGDELFSEDLW
jgi:hypothetical protein